jgi:hypothetical protein
VSRISEAERHSVRVRISRQAHEQAQRLARAWGCEVAEAIVRVLAEASPRGDVHT